jgi:hypothetical protein
MNVVVAGRVSVELVVVAGAAGGCEGAWAAAGTASASARNPGAMALRHPWTVD